MPTKSKKKVASRTQGAADQGAGTDSERLHRFLAAEWQCTLSEYPELATNVGHPGRHRRWTDWSLRAIERRKKHSRQALAWLESFARDDLSNADRLNHELFLRKIRLEVAAQQFPGEYLPVSQCSGMHLDVDRYIRMMPALTVEDYEDIVERLRRVPDLVRQIITLLEKGVETGITQPRIPLRDLPRQVADQIVADPLASSLLHAFTRFPDSVPSARRQGLRRQAAAVYRDEIVPAFSRLHRYLDESYLPHCRAGTALADLRDGDAWYAFKVRAYTTTDLTAPELHALGQTEVRRIRTEMQKVIARAGFKGRRDAFVDFLRTDPQFFFTDSRSLLAAYRDIAKRIDPQLSRLFGRLPRQPYGIVPVPCHAERSAPTAYYEAGSLQAGRAGYFFANTYNLRARPKWEMEPLTVHEAVPGHHLQIALARELTGLPEFRKHQNFTAFIEGWALYAECLGEELGLYNDPYSKYGQLCYEMWRAVRLVVDTGLHVLGWSRDRAIAYTLENTGKTEHDVISEVDRYIVWPGQALAYKVGELTIKRLRTYAAAELGSAFDLRAFHDELLANGPLPMDVLENRLTQWVAAYPRD